MTLTDILNLVDSEASERIQAALREGLITEKQLIRIFITYQQRPKDRDSLGVNASLTINELARRLSFIFHWLNILKVKSKDKAAWERIITRLRSYNLINDTMNECMAHYSLSQIFKQYKINSLFGDDYDGLVLVDNVKIPVEIKSRFPKIFPTLNKLLYALSSIDFLSQSNFDTHLGFLIARINNLTAEHIGEVVLQFEDLLKSLDIDNVEPYPIVYQLGKSNDYLDYNAEVLFLPTPVEKRRELNGSLDHNDEFCSNILFKMDPEDFSFSKIVNSHLILEESVKEHIANVLVDDCLKRGKNFPRDFGIIVIYTRHYSPNYEKFITNIIRKYILDKPGLAIMITYVDFNESNPKITVSKIWAGLSISPLIQKASKITVPPRRV